MEEQQKQQRRKFDKEFKLNAVRLVTEGGRRATEVARKYVGINKQEWDACV